MKTTGARGPDALLELQELNLQQPLREVREEILGLCHAAHVPVIRRTQVLDTPARTGLPSRAEVTDAAMAQCAECVMLNKVPFINEAISMLSDMLGPGTSCGNRDVHLR